MTKDKPIRSDQPALAARLAVPKLARDTLVFLVESLAVVGELAASDRLPPPHEHLQKPIGVREGLPGSGYDVGFFMLQNPLGELEGRDASRSNDGRRSAGLRERCFDGRGKRHIASKWTGGVGVHRRHAFVAAATGVRVDGPADRGLLRVLELPSFGDGNVMGVDLIFTIVSTTYRYTTAGM